MRKYLLIFLLAASHLHVNAQKDYLYTDSTLLEETSRMENEAQPEDDEEYEESGTVEYITPDDTTLIVNNHFIPADSIRELKNSRQFKYLWSLDSLLKEDLKKNAKSARNTERSLSFFERLINAPILKIVFWLLAAAVVVFILIQLIMTKGLFKRNITRENVSEKEEQEKKYTPQDYTRLIRQSCMLADYRSAVKYLFLQTLQMLSDQNHIELSAEKTNYRYLQEISPVIRNVFSRLILNYEYIWYGNQKIDRETFEKIEKEYTGFQKTIKA